MADHASYPDDFSALWGSQPEGLLTPAPPTNGGDPHVDETPVAGSNGSSNGHRAGRRLAVVEDEIREDVTRLADAIAANHLDVVHRSDLDAIRADFTHQFAVALYELMAASNARLARAEDHINGRVSEVAEAQTARLLASLEAQHRATAASTEAISAGLDSSADSQRELLAGHVDRATRTAAEVGDLAEALAALREDLCRARAELRELRSMVKADRARARRSGGPGHSR